MKFIVLIFFLALVGCSSASRYPNWEYVHVVDKKPDTSVCTFKVQEYCHKPTPGSGFAFGMFEGCHNWHKKRATVFGANTVFIEKEQSGSNDGVASYYNCNLK